jgi:V8-like Glu-specific endopeptidase
MLGTIRPNRTEVSRSFPVLGFTIRAGTRPAWFEVALATDPSLLHPEHKDKRTAQNFYSSRASGPLEAAGGEAVYLVSPPILARFAGQDRLYYAVATFASPDRANPQVTLFAPEATPFITISRSFSGQALRQMIGARNHRGGLTGDGYGAATPDTLTWAGDDAAPGTSTPLAPEQGARGAATGVATGAGKAADGSAKPSGAAAQSLDYSYSDGFDERFWSQPMESDAAAPDHDEGIEGPIPDDGPVAQAAAHSQSLALTAPEYPQASRFAPAAPVNYRASTSRRAINRVVIHITDGGSNINGTVGWFQNPDQSITDRNGNVKHINVSAHYVVGLSGEVVQMVANNDVAWHANSANGDSIGIEHTANKSRNILPTDAEYCASAALVNWLCQQYNIPMDRDHILGHSEADPHTTHTDCPNSVWDWNYYMGLVTSGSCYARDAAPAQSQAFAVVHGRAADAYPAAAQHSGGNGNGRPSGRQTVGAPRQAAARAPGRQHGARTAALDAAESFDIAWPNVPLINQTHDTSCWAAAASMVCSWRDGRIVNLNDAPRPASVADYARYFNLVAEPLQSYTIGAFRQMLEQSGPLWLSEAVSASDPSFDPSNPGYHAIVVTGLYGDGNSDGSDTFVRINDPWDRTPGTPGNPGPYLNSHDHGSQYILTWQQLIHEYEAVPNNPNLDGQMQIMHCGDNQGRTIGQGGASATSQGYSASLGSATTGYPQDPTAPHGHKHDGSHGRSAHRHNVAASSLAAVQPMDAPSNPADLAQFMVDWQRRQTAWQAGVPDTTFFPHSAICYMEMTYPDGVYSGTGFYIGRNTILTCAHNVIDWATRNGPSQIVVTPGKNGAGVEPFGHFTVKPGAWNHHPSYDGTRSFDLAVIRVDTPPPGGQFFDTLEELLVSQPSPIIVCGYAARNVDRDKQHLDADMIRTVEDETFEYNLQTEPGNSGSPVFYVTDYEDDTRRVSVMDIRIVGVHVSSFDPALNRGCRLTADKIRWIYDTANQSSSAPAGAAAQAYALSQSPGASRYDKGRAAAKPPRAKALVAPVVIPIATAIAGVVMTRILNNEGDVKWELDQMSGLKYPFNDPKNAGTAAYTNTTTAVNGLDVENLIDYITADFEIRWDWNGQALGNITISNTKTSDMLGWGLEVKANIMDDANSYTAKGGTVAFAAVRVRFYFRFTRSIGSDKIGTIDFTLYGNGDYSRQSRWTQ